MEREQALLADRAELEALITQREEMLLENRVRESDGLAMAWESEMFAELAKAMDAIAERVRKTP